MAGNGLLNSGNHRECTFHQNNDLSLQGESKGVKLAGNDLHGLLMWEGNGIANGSVDRLALT